MAGERLEAQFTVPNGHSVSASIGASATPVTVTPTPGSYFMTAYLAELQSQLNNNVQGYPSAAAAMQAAVGYGTWTSGAGWLFNISSGNDTGAFGGVTMTTSGAVTYDVTGPRSGIDKAVNFDGSTARFDAGNTFDVSGTDDLIVAWVGRFTGDATVNGTVCGRLEAGFAAGWSLESTTTSNLRFRAGAGASVDSTISNLLTNEWHVGIAFCDRSGNAHRIGIQGLTSGTQVLGTTGTPGATTYAATANFRVGAAVSVSQDNHDVAALYIVEGSGVATGLTANFATALSNLRNAVNDAWTVALSSTTGLVTASGSFWPRSIEFTSTTTRDLLGFERDFNYPQTSTLLNAAVGYGQFSGIWLLNESSGNLVPILGSPTLTAANLTYSNLGARGGTDKAIGFSTTSGVATGGDTYDVTASDDLIVAFVARHTATPAGDSGVLSKYAVADTARWRITCGSSSSGYYQILGTVGGSDFSTTATSALHVGATHAVIAVMERATGKIRIGSQSLATGTQAISSEATFTAGSLANATNFALGLISGALNADTTLQISYLAVGVGSGYATGASANLSTALSNFSASLLSQTATQAPSGVWFPGCTLAADSDPLQAPRGDDGRATISPTGAVYGLASTLYFRHRNLRFSHVAQPRVWSNSATVVGADYETWYLETQRGQHAWFSPYSKINVYWDNAGVATLIGSGDVSGWKMPKPTKLDDLRLASDPWTGLVEINLGDLYSDG